MAVAKFTLDNRALVTVSKNVANTFPLKILLPLF